MTALAPELVEELRTTRGEDHAVLLLKHANATYAYVANSSRARPAIMWRDGHLGLTSAILLMRDTRLYQTSHGLALRSKRLPFLVFPINTWNCRPYHRLVAYMWPRFGKFAMRNLLRVLVELKHE